MRARGSTSRLSATSAGASGLSAWRSAHIWPAETCRSPGGRARERRFAFAFLPVRQELRRAMPRPRVLIADDHRTVVDGLQQLLSGRFDVVGAVDDGRLVADAVATLIPDVILIDISMPGLTGLEATRRLKQFRPGCRVIV